MPTENDFLAFAAASGANVLDQADYAALAAVSTGFTAGIADPQQLNTVWRRSSIITNMIAQWIVDQTGQPAIDDGTIATLEANFASSITGRLINIQNFASAGTFTYTPTPGTKSLVVLVQAGGGGGGGSSATSAGQGSVGCGGAGGGYTQGRITSGFTPTVAITIGAGGPGGATTLAGTSGGASSFGSLMTATGGGGGPAGGTAVFPVISTANSIPGTGAGGNIVATAGGVGGIGIAVAAAQAVSCAGGRSYYAEGASPIYTSGVGNTAPVVGAGGGGGMSLNGAAGQSGGPGLRGAILIYEYA